MLGTAYHEAGHAVAAHALGYPLKGILIESDFEGKLGHSGSDVLAEPLKSSSNWQKNVVSPDEWQAACDDVVIHLAGAMSEEQQAGREYAPNPDEPRSTDEREIVGRLGRMCGPNYEAQNELLADSVSRTRDLITEHWPEIQALANALMERRTMTGAETIAAITAASAL